MKRLLLFTALLCFLPSCKLLQGTGDAFIGASVHTTVLDIEFTGEAYAVVANEKGYAELRGATALFLPISRVDFDEAVILLGTFDGEIKYKGGPDEPVPYAVGQAVIAGGITEARLGQMGIIFLPAE